MSDILNYVAIVGLAGRFPGAENVAAFWDNLRDGVESITRFSDKELRGCGVNEELLRNPSYVPAKAILDDVEHFDAAFFRFNPREAEVLDPQHRLFLECAWEALETAGYDPDRFGGAIGVYAGASLNTYMLTHLLSNPQAMEAVGAYQVMLSSDKDFLPTRTSFKLNLKGPSVNVQTACSTSLVAVQLAYQSLLTYQCDMALAGGVAVSLPHESGYLHQQGMILSPDGHCRAFDERAQGTVSGEGVGIVVLKRLVDALEDRDTIRAVIRGAAINNDGALKVGYTAPSVDGQAEVIAMAQAIADTEPETITYVEAHGTGTTLGDPIEIAALTDAFRASTEKAAYCAIGSLKTNIGHLDAAAGVAGLIKTVLALEHKQIPPSLNFERPNPKIDFTNSPFYVNDRLRPWETDGTPRRAGVSSFGIGGTNAHVVLEEAPEVMVEPSARKHQLFVLSARTSTALDTIAENLASHLEAHPNEPLADIAYTLQVGRRPFAHRRVLVGSDPIEVTASLRRADSSGTLSAVCEAENPPVAFMFTGQGAQYVGMAQDLFQDEPVVRDLIDRAAIVLQGDLDHDLREVLYPKPDQTERATHLLQETRYTQPALFVVEYALAKLWMAWGVEPETMIGHSIGEYVAACLAGVFTFEDALRLVAARGRMMQGLPNGDMLAVPLSGEAVGSYLNDELSLAVANGPELSVISGPKDQVDALQHRLESQGLSTRRLRTSHAFHSGMMEPIIASFTDLVSSVSLRPPQIPFISNVSGTWITEAEATDPAYWAQHLRYTVRFSDGLQKLCEEPNRILLEVGPGRTLATLARQHPACPRQQRVINSLPHPHDAQSHSDASFFLKALGKLWVAGVAVDWFRLHAPEKRRRVPLPTYPFERQRYWIDARGVQNPSNGVEHQAEAMQKRSAVADWFYVPSWKRSAPARLWVSSAPVDPESVCLVFSNGTQFEQGLIERLERDGFDVVRVQVGESFERNRNRFTVRPDSPEDFDGVLSALARDNRLPSHLLHLWNLSFGEVTSSNHEVIRGAIQHGYYGLIYLAQALGRHQGNKPLQMLVLSNQLHEAVGGEEVCAGKAVLQGPCRTIPHEYPHIDCRSVDVLIPAPDSSEEVRLLDQLAAELRLESSDRIVAYRNGHRWSQILVPTRFEPTGFQPRLQSQGVYLITGGLGGIGLVLADYLAEAAQAKLVLVGRSGLPPRTEWPRWLDTNRENDKTSRRIRGVQALEAKGAEVIVAEADVTSLEQMRAVVEEAKERFGRIHGVVHAAGVPGGGVIQLKTIDVSKEVLAPKVEGTLVLGEIFQKQPLDWAVFCSSINAMVAVAGMADYCSANAFLDAFAHQGGNGMASHITSLNWDTWQETGMAVNTDVGARLESVKEENLRHGLTNAEAQEVFRRVLNSPVPQVLVSTLDVDLLLKRVAEASGDETSIQPETALDVGGELNPTSSYERPYLESAFIAPRSDLERKIAGVWENALGIEGISVQDDFFELGGHSLLGTQVVARLREVTTLKVTLQDLFDAPTVASLGVLLTQKQSDEVEEARLLELLEELDGLSPDQVQAMLKSDR